MTEWNNFLLNFAGGFSKLVDKPAYHKCPPATDFGDSESADLPLIPINMKITYHNCVNGKMLVYHEVPIDGERRIYVEGYRKTTAFRQRVQVVPKEEREEVKSGLAKRMGENNKIKVLFLP